MPRRHPPAPPRIWLMTDERMGEALWRALDRLPRGSGVVFRHHATPEAERRALFARVERAARRRGLVLLSARVRRAGAAGTHNPRRPCAHGLVTRAAHSRVEAITALRGCADLVFVSPVFATRSHPGAKPLGILRFAAMVRGIEHRVVALGGMNHANANRLSALGVTRWAAIDALAPPVQKRKAVPT